MPLVALGATTVLAFALGCGAGGESNAVATATAASTARPVADRTVAAARYVPLVRRPTVAERASLVRYFNAHPAGGSPTGYFVSTRQRPRVGAICSHGGDPGASEQTLLLETSPLHWRLFRNVADFRRYVPAALLSAFQRACRTTVRPARRATVAALPAWRSCRTVSPAHFVFRTRGVTCAFASRVLARVPQPRGSATVRRTVFGFHCATYIANGDRVVTSCARGVQRISFSAS